MVHPLPHNLSIFFTLAGLIFSPVLVHPVHAGEESLLEEGRASEEARDFGKAQRAFEKAVHNNPESYEALFHSVT